MANGAGRVPVFQCARDAWMFLVRNWRPLLAPAAICGGLSQIGLAATVLVAPQNAAAPGFIAVIPTLLAGVMFAAAVLRKAVREEYVAPLGLAMGQDEFRLIGVGACIALLAVPLIFLLSIVLTATVFSQVVASPEAAKALAEDPRAMMKAIEEALGPGGLVVLEILSLLLLCIVFGLISLVEAATVGEKRIVLFQALAWLGGNVFRVFGACLLTVAPSLIATSFAGAIAAPLVADAVTLIALSIVVAFLSNLANVPVIALGAILYKGLRPTEFVAR